MRGTRRCGSITAAILLTVLSVTGLLAAPTSAEATPAPGSGRTYTNPVLAGVADTFADPSIIRADGRWYAYGTSDPLTAGAPVSLMPIVTSTDLVHWKHVGDVFTAATRPTWATPTAGLWAPDIRRVGDRYLLYFTVTDTTAKPGDDSAIGVAASASPAGPWVDSGGPVVAPRPAADGSYLWTFDPAYLKDAQGRSWLYYGSYFGGIWVVPLSADGLRVTGPATRVAIDNRYEGAYVVRHGGWYYLMASEANCCAGPTTGYSVYAGRSHRPTGPFADRDGISLNTSAVGGTPVIQPNGNRWVGTGHNAVFTDDAGQDWLLYHAIDRNDPYLSGTDGVNQRPMLYDRLSWAGGWPHATATDSKQRAPVVGRPGHPSPVRPAKVPRVGPRIPGYGDEFTGTTLGADWTQVRSPAVTVAGGQVAWPVEATDLTGPANTAGILLTDAPAGRYVVETKVRLDLGLDSVRNYQQAGLVAYRTDDDFARLTSVAIFNTRQTEFGREFPYAGRLPYGGMAVGTPAATVWLRLAHSVAADGEHVFRAASSRDGRHWTWAGSWTFPAGPAPQIGLVAHGGAEPAAVARFDYVRFYRSKV